VFSEDSITGLPNGPVLFCSLASVVCRRQSSPVTLPAGGRAGHRAHGRSAAAGPDAWAVGRPTLHGGPDGCVPLGRHRVICIK